MTSWGHKSKVAVHCARLLEPLHVQGDVEHCVCCFGCCVAYKVLLFITCGGSEIVLYESAGLVSSSPRTPPLKVVLK